MIPANFLLAPTLQVAVVAAILAVTSAAIVALATQFGFGR